MSPRILNAAAGAGAALIATAAWPQKAEFIDFRTVQPRSFTPMAVSADGATVVGDVWRDRGDGYGFEPRAARWSPADGLSELGTLSVNRGMPASGSYLKSTATGVNANGTVIVGSSSLSDSAPFDYRAFRWTRQTGMVNLGVLNGGRSSAASGVSADGRVVIGTADDGANAYQYSRAFRWTQDIGMVSLGVLNGGLWSAAFAISANGAVVVGSADDGQLGGGLSAARAFRWTQSTGMVSLGSVSGLPSWATSVSADGAVIVGTYEQPEIRRGRHLSSGPVTNRQAFRWTEAGAMESLVNLDGMRNSTAAAVSADGKVIVGTVGGQSPGDPYMAFRWTREKGMQSIDQWLRENGGSGGGRIALGTNADGSVVVGLTWEDGFVARVSPLGIGLITLGDVEQSLATAAAAGTMLFSALGTMVNGAHTRPLARRVAVGGNAFWIAGDLARDDHGSREGNFAFGEAGVGRNFGPAQINVSIGQSRATQDLALNGRAKTEGTYVLAQALIPLQRSFTATLGGYAGWGESELRRGYVNGGTPDFSSGSPDTTVFGVRARVDWENAAKLANASLSPYVDLMRGRAKLDGYTESGGGFPARFEARRETVTELRIGTTAIWPLSNSAQLVSLLEAAHRFERSGARTTGELVGLFAFDLPGERYDRDWVRVGAGIEGKLGPGTASLMLNATTRGSAPSYWASASWQLAF